MGIERMHTFSYDGRRLSDFGAVIAQRPTQVVSVRSVDFSDTPFVSGDELLDNGRYENIELSIKIRAVPAFCFKSFTTFCYELTEWLNTGSEYKIYRDTYNPNYYRLGFVTNISDIVAVYRDVYETTITINCKPFLYSDAGLKTQTFSTTEDNLEIALKNPEKWDSEPVFKITGAGRYNLIAGNVVMGVIVDDPLTIDKTKENVYNDLGEPCNNRITGLKIPYLQSGDNEIVVNRISGTGEFSVEVTPNWRRL